MERVFEEAVVSGASLVRVGIDIGGTFTDIVLAADGRFVGTRKVPSSVDDYTRAIVSAVHDLLAEHAIPASDVTQIVHATTVATNAILEGKGSPTALITTRGFRDVLELRRIRIPELYNLLYERPPPLVPRRLRFEVDERVSPKGEVWQELDAESVASVLEQLQAAQVEAVAICFLNSYANPVHEKAVADAVKKHLPDAFVTYSAEILREIREYERTSTTTINAYVGPPIRNYLRTLQTELRAIGVAAPIFVMQCNGEMMTADLAEVLPCNVVESGPAAGVKGATRLADATGYERMITLDVGGTTAKVAAIEDGRVLLTSDYEVGGGINVRSQLVRGGGYALKVPAVDLTEVGAGGGSIAWLDPGMRLHVGPKSAGAMPGPVCYGLGGDEATLTDANLALGYLPAAIAGGSVALDREAAESAIQTQIAGPLGLRQLEAAYGIYELASANMVRAVKAVSTFRGRDPRDSVLVAFGGCGPMCAAQMARSLGIRNIVVPQDAGLFSAIGLLSAQLQFGRSKTYLRRALPESVESLNAALLELEAEARSLMGLGTDDVDAIVVKRFAEMRYADQGYELTVEVPPGALGADAVKLLREAFETEHVATYGHSGGDEEVDIVNLRVTVALRGEEEVGALGGEGAPIPLKSSAEERDAYFGGSFGLVSTPVATPAGLSPEPVSGPLIIEEYDFTCVVPPDFTVAKDDLGSLVLTRTER